MRDLIKIAVKLAADHERRQRINRLKQTVRQRDNELTMLLLEKKLDKLKK